MSPQTASKLVYLPFGNLNLFLSIVLLVTEPLNNRLVRFHAWQSLILNGLAVLLAVLAGLITPLLPKPLHHWCSVLVVVVQLLVMSISICVLFCQDKRGANTKLPIIGPLADRCQ